MWLLVRTASGHTHTHCCYKYGSKDCRFCFPRPVVGVTHLDEHLRLHYERSPDSIFINNYNSNVLKLIKCNHDIQVLTCSTKGPSKPAAARFVSRCFIQLISLSLRALAIESSPAVCVEIVHYVAKYATKSSAQNVVHEAGISEAAAIARARSRNIDANGQPVATYALKALLGLAHQLCTSIEVSDVAVALTLRSRLVITQQSICLLQCDDLKTYRMTLMQATFETPWMRTRTGEELHSDEFVAFPLGQVNESNEKKNQKKTSLLRDLFLVSRIFEWRAIWWVLAQHRRRRCFGRACRFLSLAICRARSHVRARSRRTAPSRATHRTTSSSTV